MKSEFEIECSICGAELEAELESTGWHGEQTLKVDTAHECSPPELELEPCPCCGYEWFAGPYLAAVRHACPPDPRLAARFVYSGPTEGWNEAVADYKNSHRSPFEIEINLDSMIRGQSPAFSRPVHLLGPNAEPRPEWFAEYFAAGPNPRPFSVSTLGGIFMIDSFSDWLSFCEQWEARPETQTNGEEA